MSNEDTQMKIRVPVELKEKIQQVAKKNNRSMNAEIINMLEKATFDLNDFESLIAKMKDEITDALQKAMDDRDKVYQDFLDKRYNKS